jgi:hypothetical protein
MAFEATELDHESAGVRTRRVLLLVGGFLVFVAALMAILAMFYRDTIKSSQVVEPLRSFPGPQLQPNPQQDYTNFRQAQDAELQGTRWVDEKNKLVHVPIDRAMAYVAGRGASAYDPLEQNADTKLPPTPADGEARAASFPPVAPYGLHLKGEGTGP